MPKGIYLRKKETTVPEISNGMGGSVSIPGIKTLNGRAVYRIMLHNGVHLGVAPTARVEKSIMAKDAPYAKVTMGLGRVVADRMVITPAGVHISFPGEIEKLVPFANIYEADLAPEAV